MKIKKLNCKKISITLMLSLIFTVLVSCSIGGQKSDGGEKPTQKDKQAELIQEQIGEMTLEEKIGQMVIVGLEGYEMDENARIMIEERKVGGFIFFSKNIESFEQLLGLTNRLKSANSKNNIPLFLSVDEEGGRVSRMPSEFKKLPSSREIGRINDPELSYEIGSTIASQIKSVGFNMDFAPVLDVDSNPNNPVIGDRSFGDSPELVSELGIQTMKGIQDKGVVPVAKHFPGHGDTDVDSHLGLPVVDKSLEELSSLELIPFRDAVESGADAVMVAHILYKSIDSENPSTMSKPVIQDLLREQMGFDGLVVTDDMTMGAIMENYDIGEASVKSVKAGSDIVLVCHGHENEIKVLDSLKVAVEAGEIAEERIDETVYRILKTKQKYNLKDENIEDTDMEKTNSHVDSILERF